MCESKDMWNFMTCCLKTSVDKDLLILTFEHFHFLVWRGFGEIVSWWTMSIRLLERYYDVIIWCLYLFLAIELLLLILVVHDTDSIAFEPGWADKALGDLDTLLIWLCLTDSLVSIFGKSFDFNLGLDQVVKLMLFDPLLHISFQLTILASLVIKVRPI